MKKIIFSSVLLLIIFTVNSQITKTDVLQDLEKNKSTDQNPILTATIKSATRLFKDKDDLTSVIMVIPPDSIVYVIDSDDTFLHVGFGAAEGYVYARHAEINKTAAKTESSAVKEPGGEEEILDNKARPVQQQKISRFTYLENKYGSSMAARLYSGKIWKGMNSEMVKDSWGSPKKINRVISGNAVNEEWFYNSTWLHFQNSSLTDWGPLKN